MAKPGTASRGRPFPRFCKGVHMRRTFVAAAPTALALTLSLAAATWAQTTTQPPKPNPPPDQQAPVGGTAPTTGMNQGVNDPAQIILSLHEVNLVEIKAGELALRKST